MAEGFVFDQRGAGRIVSAVRQVERRGPDRRPQKTGSPEATPPFWAKITGKVDDTDPQRYQWTKTHQEDGDQVEESVTGDGAIEANGNDVPNDTVVLLRFEGYDDDDKPVYLFESLTWPPGLQYQVLQRPDDVGSPPIFDYVRATNG